MVCGVSREYSTTAAAFCVPAWSKTAAFREVVPMSMPRISSLISLYFLSVMCFAVRGCVIEYRIIIIRYDLLR